MQPTGSILLSAIRSSLRLFHVIGFYMCNQSDKSFVLVEHKLVINVMRFEVRYLAVINVL